MLERLWLDLRYSARTLARSPSFTLIAVISLAIGIGANCAVFSAADAALLRPLTVPRPGDVLTVGSRPLLGEPFLSASYREYVDIRDRSQSFASLVAFTGTVAAIAPEAGAPARLRLGMLTTANLFTAMGVEPSLGRAFRPEEDEVPGRDAVVVLGHDFWEQQFGADRSIIGRRLRLNGLEFTVIGVAPDGFAGLDRKSRFDFYAPLAMWQRLVNDPGARPFEARDYRRLVIKGRLKSGVSLSQAQSELSVIANDLQRAYPDVNRNRTLAVRTQFQAQIADDLPDALLIAMLTALSAAVLFVACANVAGLLTCRAPMRAREIALRLALGASRPRIVRQLITESLLLALMGGAVGLGIGYAAVAMFRQVRLPSDLPILMSFDLDRRALLVSFVVALVSALLSGLVPAIQASRADLTGTIKATDAAGFGRRRRWGRALLVGGQVAVSVVLLVVATFVYRGFQQRLASGPGYRTDHLLTMGLDPALVRYSQSQTDEFFDRVVDGARLVPGVKAAGLASAVPMGIAAASYVVPIIPEGFRFPPGKESELALAATVDEPYFDMIGVAILKGRPFGAGDSAGAPKVAVVNEELAGRYWPSQDPIGKRFRTDESGRRVLVQIVGVAKNSKYMFIMEPPQAFLYFPRRQRPQQAMTLLVESFGDPASLAGPLRDVVRGLDAGLPIHDVRTMDEVYRMRATAILNLVSRFIAALSVMGLILAIVGLYGLVAYAAARRTREIGIRMALGAGRWDVVAMVVRQGLMLAVCGLGVGLLASAGAGRALMAVFPGGAGGTGRTDFGAFPAVALAVLAMTFVAAYIPARRASRVDPTKALRYE